VPRKSTFRSLEFFMTISRADSSTSLLQDGIPSDATRAGKSGIRAFFSRITAFGKGDRPRANDEGRSDNLVRVEAPKAKLNRWEKATQARELKKAENAAWCRQQLAGMDLSFLDRVA
jgi:hypothetical protein